MGQVECCITRDRSTTGHLRTYGTCLYPTDHRLVDGAYSPLIRYWESYKFTLSVLEEKLAQWPTKCPNDGKGSPLNKWDPRSKILYELFHRADADGDLFVEWENGEIRSIVRQMCIHDSLPQPQMNWQTWVALFREYERDDRNMLNFWELCLFVKHVYQILLDLASGGRTPVEVAPNVYIPQRTSNLNDAAPSEKEMSVSRKFREQELQRQLDELNKQQKEEMDVAYAEKLKIEKERKRAERDLNEAEKRKKEFFEEAKKKEQEEKVQDNEIESRESIIVDMRTKRSSTSDEGLDLSLKNEYEKKRMAITARRKALESENKEIELIRVHKNRLSILMHDENEIKKQIDMINREYMEASYKVKTRQEENITIQSARLLPNLLWYIDYQLYTIEMLNKLDDWENKTNINTMRALFDLVDKDHDGYIHWNNSEIRTYVKQAFIKFELPRPILTETQWNLLLNKFDTGNPYHMGHKQGTELIKYLLEESLADENEFSQDLKERYRSFRATIINILQMWDDNILKGLDNTFFETDQSRKGYLDWNNSEIRNFCRLVFNAHGLPLPPICESIWYQLYREVDKDANYYMGFPEGIIFIRHMYRRILNFIQPMEDENQPVSARSSFRLLI